MNWIFVAVVALFAAGIAYLGATSSSSKRPRKDLLDDLTKLVDGVMEPIEGFENSFRIRFDFEGHDFYYEDFETQGFNEKVFKSYLKTDTKENFTLVFGEKHGKKLLNHTGDKAQAYIKIPDALKDFGVDSNKPKVAEELLQNAKVVKLFKSYRNVDARGRAFIPLKYASGTIVLEFDHTGKFNPKPLQYATEAVTIEGFLDQLILLKEALESVTD